MNSTQSMPDGPGQKHHPRSQQASQYKVMVSSHGHWALAVSPNAHRLAASRTQASPRTTGALLTVCFSCVQFRLGGERRQGWLNWGTLPARQTIGTRLPEAAAPHSWRLGSLPASLPRGSGPCLNPGRPWNGAAARASWRWPPAHARPREARLSRLSPYCLFALPSSRVGAQSCTLICWETLIDSLLQVGSRPGVCGAPALSIAASSAARSVSTRRRRPASASVNSSAAMS